MQFVAGADPAVVGAARGDDGNGAGRSGPPAGAACSELALWDTSTMPTCVLMNSRLNLGTCSAILNRNPWRSSLCIERWRSCGDSPPRPRAGCHRAGRPAGRCEADRARTAAHAGDRGLVGPGPRTGKYRLGPTSAAGQRVSGDARAARPIVDLGGLSGHPRQRSGLGGRAQRRPRTGRPPRVPPRGRGTDSGGGRVLPWHTCALGKAIVALPADVCERCSAGSWRS